MERFCVWQCLFERNNLLFPGTKMRNHCQSTYSWVCHKVQNILSMHFMAVADVVFGQGKANGKREYSSCIHHVFIMYVF